MPDQRRAERDLDRLWDQVVRDGQVEEIGVLDLEQAETIRRFQALAAAPVPTSARRRAWKLLARTQPASGTDRAVSQAGDLVSPRRLIGPNGRVEGAPGRWAGIPVSRPRSWPASQVVTALLLLVTFLGVYVVFRPERRSTLPPAHPTAEVLATVAIEGLPGGDYVHVFVDRLFVQPGATANGDSDGLMIGRVERGQLAVRIGDQPERLLGPGEVFAVAPGTSFGIRATDDSQTIYQEVRIRNAADDFPLSTPFEPGQVLRVELSYQILTGRVPPGPAEVALVRLTLGPGERLDETAEDANYWALVVEAGVLGIDYLRTGEELAPEATPAYEQTDSADPGPSAAGVLNMDPDARRILGNAGEEPLVLLVVRITPVAAPFMAAAGEATP